MKKSKMVYLMMAAAMLASCSADQEGQETTGAMPISLGYSVAEVQTRAATNLNNGTIPDGESVTVLIKKSSDASFTSYVYEAGGTAGNLIAPTPAPEYPSDGAPVDIMAFYPHDANAIFTVKTDQTSDANYNASDLMVASPILSQYRSPNKVKLQFYHKMAKIIVNASPAAGSSFTISGVSLTAKPKAYYQDETGSVELYSDASNTATSITMTNGGAALIPAQTITGGFITVTTSGGTATYSVNGKPFEMGHQYTIDLSVSVTDLGMTNDITDWIVETTESGSTANANSLGELTNIVNSGGAYSEYLGKYVDADGKILANSTNATGIIAYISTSDVDEDVPGSRILVLSASDVSTGVAWGPNEFSGASQSTDLLNGYQNTIYLSQKYSNYAADKCWSYSANRPGLATKWFLPSYRQWARINSDGVGRSVLTTDKYYWSSTEDDTSAGRAGYYSTNGSMYRNFDKDNATVYVRACYAYPSVYASLTSAHIGQLLTSDGCVCYDKAAADAAGKTPVAMIVYVGDPGTADSSPGAEHYRGLAIALKDANNKAWAAWCQQTSETCLGDLRYGSYSDACKTDLNGIKFTKAMISHGSHTHNAATCAIDNNGTVAPNGTSNWFLPSIGQWNLMLKTLLGGDGLASTSNSTYNASAVNIFFENAGLGNAEGEPALLSNAYWSSTESVTNASWAYYSANAHAFQANKEGHVFVRAFLAF